MELLIAAVALALSIANAIYVSIKSERTGTSVDVRPDEHRPPSLLSSRSICNPTPDRKEANPPSNPHATRSHPKPTEAQLNKYSGSLGETTRWNPKPTSKPSRPRKEDGDSIRHGEKPDISPEPPMPQLKNKARVDHDKDELLHDLIHYIKSREVISSAYAGSEVIESSVGYDLDNEELKAYVDLYFDKEC